MKLLLAGSVDERDEPWDFSALDRRSEDVAQRSCCLERC
jgi:hypothetical protein